MKIALIGYLSNDEVILSQGVLNRAGGPVLHMAAVLKEEGADLIIVTNRNVDPIPNVKIKTVPDVDSYTVRFQDAEQSLLEPTVTTPRFYRKISINDLPDEIMSVDAVIISSVFDDIEPEVIYQLQRRVRILAIDAQGFQRSNSTAGKLIRSKANIEFLIGANVVKFNEKEAIIQFGDTENEIRKFSDAENKIVLITKGAKGCDIWHAGKKASISAPQVKLKSSVGAGDMLLAGFVYRLLVGQDINAAVENSQLRVIEHLELQFTMATV